MGIFRTPNARKSSIEFIKSLSVVKKADFSPWAVYTQACHETGFFYRVIGRNNYWGIKKPRDWHGPTARTLTKEWENDREIIKVAEFADWDTAEEALGFYTALIERLYPDSYRCRSCHNCFFRNLISGKFKWATDPNYDRKLLTLYDMVRREPEINLDFNQFLPKE